MKQSNNGQEMIELMNMVEEITNSGPVVSRSTKNDYTRKECSDMLSYISKYIKMGKAPKSFKGDFQSFLNTVGHGMERFKEIKTKDPAAKSPSDGTDMYSQDKKFYK